MTLFQHTLKALLRGEKTETSRLALPEPDGTACRGTEMIQYPSGVLSVMRGADMRWFPKWQVARFADVIDMINHRPAEYYQAWRMTVRVLWDTVDWDAPAVMALHIAKSTVQ
jgi:hypothetical protein